MNCRISESALRSVCRELVRTKTRVSHRSLRATLRERFGASGKTSRVLGIWREEAARLSSEQQRAASASSDLPQDVRELQQRLEIAERTAEQMRARAELAEMREQSHQDRWALEIDRLREQLRVQPNQLRELQALQVRVRLLTAQLAVMRGEERADP